MKHRYSLPRINAQIDQFQGATVFSKIDFQSGYHQLKIKEDISKSAFHARYGHYEFLLMSFVLTNALIALMIVFINDILVYSKSQAEHKEHLQIMIRTLREHNLYAKFNKCEF